MTLHRIVLIDDHSVLRSGLKLLLESQKDFLVVAEGADGVSAVKAVQEYLPDVLVLDLALPGADGFSVIRDVKRISPLTRLVVLTMHDGRAYFKGAIAAGADAFVPKNTADVALMTAIRSIETGKFYGATSPPPRRNKALEVSCDRPAVDSLDLLSERERSVLVGISRGMTNQQMADEMDVSIKSIESYRSRLMQKLGVSTRAQLVELAVAEGLLFFNRDEHS